MIQSTSWILCLIWMTNAIGAYAGVLKRRDLENQSNVLEMPKGKAYYAVKEKKTWDQARATCQELGGDLAQIRTVEDQKHVAKFLNDHFSVGSWGSTTGSGNEWWIGASRDSSNKKRWRWVDGDKVSKDIGYKWDKPNLRDTNEKCLSIHRNPVLVESEVVLPFGAGKCQDAWEFVCEKYELFPVWP